MIQEFLDWVKICIISFACSISIIFCIWFAITKLIGPLHNHKGCVKNRMKKIKNLIHNDIHYIKDTMRIKNKNDLPANIFSVILITVFSVGYGLFITVIILRYIL